MRTNSLVVVAAAALAVLLAAAVPGVEGRDEFELQPGVPEEIPVEKYRMPRVKAVVQNADPIKGFTLYISTFYTGNHRWLISDEDYPVDVAHAKWMVWPETNGINSWVEWTVPACEYTTLARLGDEFTLYITFDVHYATPPADPVDFHFVYHNAVTMQQLEESPGAVQLLEWTIPVCAPDAVMIIKSPPSAVGQEVEMALHPGASILPFEMDTMSVAKYQGPHAFYCPEPEASWERDEWVNTSPYGVATDQGIVVTWTQEERPDHRCAAIPVTLAVTVGAAKPVLHPTMTFGQISTMVASAGVVALVAWVALVPLFSRLILGPGPEDGVDAEEGEGGGAGEAAAPTAPAPPRGSSAKERVKAQFSRLVPVFIPALRASGKGSVAAPPAYESLLAGEEVPA